MPRDRPASGRPWTGRLVVSRVVVTGEDQPPLRDAVAKAAWLSEVTPLEDLSVGVLAPGAKYVEHHDYAFQRDAASYLQKWRPRPGA